MAIKFEDYPSPKSRVWGNMEWHWASTMLAHNCHGESEPNTNWSHTSRFETPLKCWGCGKKVPTNIELEYRCLMERRRIGKSNG